MAYEPQPGTIPHRAMAWLRAMAKCRPGYEPSSVEICAGLDIDPDGFVAYMRYVREHGLVHTRKAPVGRLLYWRLGDGKQDPTLGWRRSPAVVAFDAQVESAPVPTQPEFRALVWDGNLLATGMVIRDGVAVFTPEHIEEIKRLTAWLPPVQQGVPA
jgi:hypothetical protein